MTPTFFETAVAFRAWLAENHTTAEFLWVGLYKKGSGRPSLSWPESVDEALCVGWIDGVRKGLSADSYAIRFTRRKAGSTWSAANVKRVQSLTELGRMQPAGLAEFAARRDERSGIYSYEQGEVELPAALLGILRENAAAWEFFQKQPAYYRKVASWWVASAKKDETRLNRMEKLIAHSARCERMPQFTSRKASS